MSTSVSAATFPVRLADREVGFECREGDTVLRAALRSGVELAYECNSGGCGSCKVVIDGDSLVSGLGRPTPGLTERDLRKGRSLACQTVPLGPCSITGAVIEQDRGLPRPARHRGRVVARRPLTADLFEIGVELDEPMEFIAGQYAMLDPGLGEDRAYSMANLPGAHRLDFHVKTVPDGAVSNALVALSIGDEVGVDGPYGMAYFRETGRDVVLVAGGSGLGPMVGVARALAQSASADARNLHFFFGGRAVADLCAETFVDETRGTLKGVSYYPAISNPDGDPEWTGHRGFVHELLSATELPDLHEHEFYVAGPPPMTDAVVRLLVVDLHIDPTQVHFDRFF